MTRKNKIDKITAFNKSICKLGEVRELLSQIDKQLTISEKAKISAVLYFAKEAGSYLAYLVNNQDKSSNTIKQ